MDSRIYFHQERRPRYDNRTYRSNGVQATMMTHRKNINYSKDNISQRKNDYQFNQSYENNSKFVPNAMPESKVVEANNSYENYYKPKNNSSLSSYGTQSLSINQTDVVNRQNVKFDILNFQPKQHSNEIKKYPRLTLQNRDDVYYKRMNDVYNEKRRIYEEKQIRDQLTNFSSVAGKQRYNMEEKAPYNPEYIEQTRGSQKFSPKMLNHMDELSYLS